MKNWIKNGLCRLGLAGRSFGESLEAEGWAELNKIPLDSITSLLTGSMPADITGGCDVPDRLPALRDLRTAALSMYVIMIKTIK